MPARRTATRRTASTASGQRRAADERARDAKAPADGEEDIPADEGWLADEEDTPVEEEDAPVDEEDLPDDEEEDLSDEEEDVPAGKNAHRMSAAAAAQAGKRGLLELIGKRIEGITAVEPTGDGWRVGIEVLEDPHVPSSADLLALYEVELDQEQNLVSYRRTRRYPRGRGDSEGDR
jgi:Gas vesicle synthesis protein GvpO